LSIKRNIIIKAIQLALGINVVNIIISLLLSYTSIRSIDLNNIKGIFGNITMLESGLFLLYGLIGAYFNSPRLGWDNKDESNPTLVQLRGGKQVTLTKRRMELVDNADPSKQIRPFISLLCGAIFLSEIILLALLVV
jgi:hypothetical protein